MQSRERAPLVVELVLAVAATIVLVALPATMPQHPRPIAIELAPSTPPIQLATQTVDPTYDAIARADECYRHKNFSGAGNILRVARGPELVPLAELYEELARTYAVATDPSTPAIEQFEALVVARRLDLALGGAFFDDLTARLATVTPKAAVAYVARHDDANARLAIGVGESLGLRDDANFCAVTKYLEHHRPTLE